MRSQRSTPETNQEHQLTSITRMILAIILIFLICNTASGVILLVFVVNGHGYWDPADIEFFSCIPIIINSSVNFIVYVFMGSKFRNELSVILTNLKRRLSIYKQKPAELQLENPLEPFVFSTHL